MTDEKIIEEYKNIIAEHKALIEVQHQFIVKQRKEILEEVRGKVEEMRKKQINKINPVSASVARDVMNENALIFSYNEALNDILKELK